MGKRLALILTLESCTLAFGCKACGALYTGRWIDFGFTAMMALIIYFAVAVLIGKTIETRDEYDE